MKTANKEALTVEKQIERVSIALQELAGQATSKDHGFVMFKMNKSIDTVRRYLRGEVGNLEDGRRMVELLRESILSKAS